MVASWKAPLLLRKRRTQPLLSDWPDWPSARISWQASRQQWRGPETAFLYAEPGKRGSGRLEKATGPAVSRGFMKMITAEFVRPPDPRSANFLCRLRARRFFTMNRRLLNDWSIGGIRRQPQ